MDKWQCSFNKPPEKITVGQKLLLLCRGDKAVSFKDSLRIEFLDNSQLYSLHILKALKKEDHFLALEVSSYRTGKFNSPFIITDGEKKLLIEGFSFSVQSVLSETKKPVQPHGPFGPFKPPLPLWYLSAMTLVFLGLMSCLFIFFNRFLKRKNLIQKILKRKTYLSPVKFFILSLRKYKKDTPDAIENLERSFKIFLEDLLFLPAVNKTNEQIMNFLKRYHRQFYKKEGQKIRQVLNELSSLQHNAKDKKTFSKLKKICQETVFLLEKSRRES